MFDAPEENSGSGTNIPMSCPYQDEYDDDADALQEVPLPKESINEVPDTVELRRSVRQRKATQRYVNSDFVN